MFCCSAAGPGIGLGTVAQNIPLWLSELWTREWFSLSPASANFLLWTSQQCYCKTQYFTFIIAQRRGYFTNVATEKWQRYPLKQRIRICCGEDQRQTCLLTHVFLVINELLPCPAPTLEVHHCTGVESIFIARFDKINDLFPLQMSRSQSCCFPFVYLKHISLRVSGISMLSFSTEKSISSRLSNRLVRAWQWLIYKYIVFMWLNWN